jgi:starvation-inducible outer membrane lipoprotein
MKKIVVKKTLKWVSLVLGVFFGSTMLAACYAMPSNVYDSASYTVSSSSAASSSVKSSTASSKAANIADADILNADQTADLK